MPVRCNDSHDTVAVGVRIDTTCVVFVSLAVTHDVRLVVYAPYIHVMTSASGIPHHRAETVGMMMVFFAVMMWRRWRRGSMMTPESRTGSGMLVVFLMTMFFIIFLMVIFLMVMLLIFLLLMVFMFVAVVLFTAWGLMTVSFVVSSERVGRANAEEESDYKRGKDCSHVRVVFLEVKHVLTTVVYINDKKHEKRFTSDLGYSLRKWFAAEMVREWFCIFGGVAEVKQHQYLLIFGQAEQRVQFVVVEAVYPAGVDISVGGSEHEMGSHDRGILNSGFTFASGIGVDIVLVESHHEHYGSVVAARGAFINFCESLSRGCYVDVLFLRFFAVGASRPPSRIYPRVLSSTGRSEYFLHE